MSGLPGNLARAFALASLLALPLCGAAALALEIRVAPRGVLLAVASGAVASGMGYALWYAVLPALGTTHAAVVQLAVPVIAAVAGVLLLGETASPRLVVASAAILGGIALVLTSQPWRRARGAGPVED